jgi:lysophospholipase L1-like esterase
MRAIAGRLVTLVALLLLASPGLAQDRRTDTWIATWSTAVVARAVAVTPPPGAPAPAVATPPLTINNQTLRQIVHTSIGGNRIRVVLSNAFGTAPLAIGAAHVALRDKEATIAAAGKRLTFSGNGSFTIPAGASVISDAVDLAVPPMADLAVDVHLPGELGPMGAPVTLHGGANQTNYVSAAGNHAGAASLPIDARTASWFLLARVEVVSTAPAQVIVAFGDSITDGTRSTVDTNNRWPDHLARRLLAQTGRSAAVVNAGIAGNRLLSEGAPQAGINALARFDRDVLMQTGVTHVVIMEGINDIGVARENPSPTAADLIAAQQQLIMRARARGLKVFGATLTPFEGAAYWTKEGEAKRQAVNQWIRSGGAYDGVIDFDAVTRDPNAPTKLQPQFDSGDHLHPNDAGYRAMGESVDLTFFAPARVGS